MLSFRISGTRNTKSNGNVKIVIGSCEIAVVAHAHWTKTAQSDRCEVGRSQIAMHSQLPIFY